MSGKKNSDPSRRRRRVIIASMLILVMFAVGASDLLLRSGGAWRGVDIVRVSGLLGLAIVLALRSTTNLRFSQPNPELDDELTRANRASAAQVGFWLLMVASTLAFFGSMGGWLTIGEAAPYLVVIGAIGAGIRFTLLEARGDTDADPAA